LNKKAFPGDDKAKDNAAWAKVLTAMAKLQETQKKERAIKEKNFQLLQQMTSDLDTECLLLKQALQRKQQQTKEVKKEEKQPEQKNDACVIQ